MVKHMLRESLYDAKQHKGRVIGEIALFIIFVLCVFYGMPNFCIYLLLVFAHIKKWDCEKEYMPEVIGCIPMSQKEKQRYMLLKSYTRAIGLSGLLWISFFYVVVSGGKYVCDDIFWWNGGCQVLSFYFYICLLELAIEIAKWKRMKAGISIQSAGTFKSGVIYAIFLLVMICIISWCSMDVFHVETIDISIATLVVERVIILTFLVIQYISYRYLKKMMLKEFIYSDYNAKITKEQEVDYEY